MSAKRGTTTLPCPFAHDDEPPTVTVEWAGHAADPEGREPLPYMTIEGAVGCAHVEGDDCDDMALLDALDEALRDEEVQHVS